MLMLVLVSACMTSVADDNDGRIDGGMVMKNGADNTCADVGKHKQECI